MSLRVGLTPSLPADLLEPATHFCELMTADSNKDVTCMRLAIEVMGMAKLPSTKAAANAAAMAALVPQTDADGSASGNAAAADSSGSKQAIEVQQASSEKQQGNELDASSAQTVQGEAVEPEAGTKAGDDKTTDQNAIAAEAEDPSRQPKDDLLKAASQTAPAALAATSTNAAVPAASSAPTPKQSAPAPTPSTPNQKDKDKEEAKKRQKKN